MKFIFIRHGETYSNTLFGSPNQILIGALDNELTQLNEKGISQAENAREQLNKLGIMESIDGIYSSDLTRTIQTTEIIFGDKAYIKDKRLRERSLGILEGMKIVDVNENEMLSNTLPDSDDMETFFDRKHPTGENYIDVYHRCSDFLNQFDYSSDKTIVIVSHFHTIRCFIYALLNKEFDENFNSLLIENSTPYIFDYDVSSFKCISGSLSINY